MLPQLWMTILTVLRPHKTPPQQRTPRPTVPDHPERGDVPGWVMVTLMTAGLVIIIWALAGEALANLFQTAMDRILNA